MDTYNCCLGIPLLCQCFFGPHVDLCFLQLKIPFKDIAKLSKERTAKVIPNAIEVITKDERFFFTSFGARDKMFVVLKNIWKTCANDQVNYNCIVLYLYIYIALLAVHTNQMRFQCERPREKRAVLRE